MNSPLHQHYTDLLHTLTHLYRLLHDDRLPPLEREATADLITVLHEYHRNLLAQHEEIRT